MLILAIFRFPGPSGGSGGPMWGFGGSAVTNFSNFRMGLFLALRCLFWTQLASNTMFLSFLAKIWASGPKKGHFGPK